MHRRERGHAAHLLAPPTGDGAAAALIVARHDRCTAKRPTYTVVRRRPRSPIPGRQARSANASHPPAWPGEPRAKGDPSHRQRRAAHKRDGRTIATPRQRNERRRATARRRHPAASALATRDPAPGRPSRRPGGPLCVSSPGVPGVAATMNDAIDRHDASDRGGRTCLRSRIVYC